jgi:hypothetical protein
MVKQLTLFLYLTVLTTVAQEVSFGKPRKLSQHINSSCEEVLPLLSPDKKKILFVRASCPENIGGGLAGSDIWLSELNDSEWDKSTNPGTLLNDKTNNAVVGISRDGGTVYQLRSSSNSKTPGIYFSKRMSSSWTKPELIPLPFLKTDGFLGLYVSPDFNVILISMENEHGRGQEDLYVSLKSASGIWSEPRNLGPAINTEGFEISPFLSLDSRRLYFASSGHWGQGNGDIFYSDRLDDTWQKWSSPINLGNHINSKDFDAYFSIYDSVAYFSSNRDSQFSDLYVVHVKNAEDSLQYEVDKIVAEARSLLEDLGDDTGDSLATDFRSVFIEFDNSSVELSSLALNRLSPVLDCLKKLKSDRVTITIIGYSSDADQDRRQCHQRLEVIKNYLIGASRSNLFVELEIKKTEKSSIENRRDAVEVRY